MLGKAVGITGATWLVSRFTKAELDTDLRWPDVVGLSLLAGIGFTVSLLIGELAFGAGSLRDEHVKVGVLTGTLLWGIMIQEAIAYCFSNTPKTVLPLAPGVMNILGVRTPVNEVLTAVVSWVAIGLLWLLVNRTRGGKALLAASMNPRGLTLLGFEMTSIHRKVWAIYGVLAGIAGVLLGAFLGVSSDNIGTLTASAFSIVVLGGLGSIWGSLLAAYVVGYLETLTAYLVAPSVRTVPVLLLLVLVVYLRPQGLLGRR